MRHYELMVILDPGLDERTVQPSLETFLNVIRSDGGSVEKVEVWGKRRLAYDIGTHREASYFLIHFDIEPAQVREIERGMLISEEILRHLVTVLEDRGPAEDLPPAAAPRTAEGSALASSDTDAGDEDAGASDEPAAPEQVEELFKSRMAEVLESWVGLADERLDPGTTPAVWMPGNDDLEFIDPYVNASKAIQNGDGRVIEVDGYYLLSLGNANVTPWNCPRDVTEDVLAQKIDALAAQVPDMSRCIFNVHAPPWGSNLDLAPELDEDFKPSVEGGGLKMIPVGSTAVLEAIQKWQPLLSLHGHIHECSAGIKIGRTLCINTGSEYH